jgi:hypothetical protein
MTIRPCQRSASGRHPPSSGVRPRRVAWFPPTGSHRASRRALSIRPARLCRAMAAPTWFGRAPLHVAVISSCVLPVARARRAMPATSSPCGRSARASWDSGLGSRSRRFGRGRLSRLPAFPVARHYTLGRLQFFELSIKLFALCINAGERFCYPLPLIGDRI